MENNLQTLDGMVKNKERPAELETRSPRYSSYDAKYLFLKNKTTKIIFLLSYNLLYHFYLCNMKKRLKDLIFY